MKKIFTLAFGLILATAMFAADRRPMVTVSSQQRFKVVIDGTAYLYNAGSVSIPDLNNGWHKLTVYSMNQGFFRKASARLVSSSRFETDGCDVNINVDRFGQIQISQSTISHGWNNSGYGSHDNSGHGYNHGHRNKDRRF